MPFTPTHVLAIVPLALLRPRTFPLSALIIGCVIPDWPLYYPIGPSYALTHSFIGLISACLPLGLGVWFCYLMLIRPSLLPMLPAGLAHFSHPARAPRPLYYYALGAVALILGAFTHIVWDAFTHSGAWGVGLIGGLASVAFTIGHEPVYWHAVLQHGGSLIGLPVLIFLALRSVVTTNGQSLGNPFSTNPGQIFFWLVFLLLPISYGIVVSQPWAYATFDARAVYAALFEFVTAAIGLMGLMFFIHGLIYVLLSAWRRFGLDPK